MRKIAVHGLLAAGVAVVVPPALAAVRAESAWRGWPGIAAPVPPPREEPAKTAPPFKPTPPPTEDPGLNNPNVQRVIEDLDKGATPRMAVAPAGQAGLAGAGGASATLVREGTFLPSRRGRVVRGPAGEWEFVFDADAQGQAEPRMTLMPCANLAALERVATEKGEATWYVLSGQVFTYGGRNWLLAIMPARIDVEKPAAPPAAAAPAAAEEGGAAAPTGAPAPAPPAGAPGTSRSADPTIEEIKAELDRGAPAPKAGSLPIPPPPPVPATVPAASHTGAPAPEPALGAPAERGSETLREGTFLVSRRGRVIRRGGGPTLLAFDGDSLGRADAPMVLLPCANLTAIERVAEQRGEGATVTVTGQVFTYHGRNYLLATMFEVNRANTEIIPVQ